MKLSKYQINILLTISLVGGQINLKNFLKTSTIKEADLVVLFGYKLIDMTKNKQGEWLYVTVNGSHYLKPVTNLIDSLDRMITVS